MGRRAKRVPCRPNRCSARCPVSSRLVSRPFGIY